jgi:hypothetical protein
LQRPLLTFGLRKAALVFEAMKELPRESLQFLAFRAADPIIRHKAAEVLDWLDKRETLPDWG